MRVRFPNNRQSFSRIHSPDYLNTMTRGILFQMYILIESLLLTLRFQAF